MGFPVPEDHARSMKGNTFKLGNVSSTLSERRLGKNFPLHGLDAEPVQKLLEGLTKSAGLNDGGRRQ